MLKQYLRSSIIVLFQFAGLATVALLVLPLLFEKTHDLHQLNLFLSLHKNLFLLIHGLFYIVIFIGWPRLIRFFANHQQVSPNQQQINQAIHSRCYLIMTFIIIECLNLLR